MSSSNQHFGWIHNEREVDRILCSMPHPTFAQAAPHLMGSGDGKVALLYEAVRKVWGRDLDEGPQLIGDCVSWGYGGSIDLLACLEVAAGEKEEHSWDLRTCTESVYALSRCEYGDLDGSYEDGSVGAWAAAAVTKGGTLSRKRLGNYDPQRAKDWGAKGLPNDLEPEAKQHTVKTASLVSSWEELKAALANGYPVPVCSMQGFSETRDAKGRCRPQGTWAHCYPPGTMVGATTPKHIEDIQKGDYVYGHDGKEYEVTETFSRDFDGNLITLKVTGIPEPIKVTEEHPILVYRYVTKGVTIRSNLVSQLPELEPLKIHWRNFQSVWVEARDVREGDYLINPKIKTEGVKVPEWISYKKTQNKPKTITEPDPDLAWLFGLYIADGSYTKRHKIQITLGINEQDTIDRLVKIVSEKLGLKASIEKYDSFVRVYVYSADLADSFALWFGTSSQTKHIPDFLFYGWDLRQLLEGVWAGDGCNYKNRRMILSTSRVLIYQLWHVLTTLGLQPRINKQGRGEGSFPNSSPAWSLVWYEDPIKSESKWFNNNLLYPVKEVGKGVYSGKVFNIEVDKVHTYTASGFVTHNCMKFIAFRDDGWSAALCMNSWGKNSPTGPKGDIDIPDNSFWVDAATVNNMLRMKDSFALSSFNGYPKRDFTIPWIFS